MIGVVVWSSDERQKAVIWCEDQGALAYLYGIDNLSPGTTWPMAGDLLELDTETIDDLRYARSVSMLNKHHCVDLPSILLNTAVEEPQLRLVTSSGKRVNHGGHDDQIDERKIRLRRLVACGG